MAEKAEQARYRMYKKRCLQSFNLAVEEGKADKQVIPFLKKVNESKYYFSSSSCAGRTLLLALPGAGTKKEAFFWERYHRKVSFKEVRERIEAFNDGLLMLKCEPFILHLGCADLEHARKILEAVRETGIKRGGIMVAKPGKFLVEFQGSESLSIPVKQDAKQLVDDDYLKFVLKSCNEKLAKNYALLKRFEKNFKPLLKEK